MVDPELTGWLFVFQHTAVASCDASGDTVIVEADDDLAFFQQDDGSLYLMTRNGKKAWAVDTPLCANVTETSAP